MARSEPSKRPRANYIRGSELETLEGLGPSTMIPPLVVGGILAGRLVHPDRNGVIATVYIIFVLIPAHATGSTFRYLPRDFVLLRACFCAIPLAAVAGASTFGYDVPLPARTRRRRRLDHGLSPAPNGPHDHARPLVLLFVCGDVGQIHRSPSRQSSCSCRSSTA